VQGKPILIRIAELLEPYDPLPTVVVSPDGEPLIAECLARHGRSAHLVVQSEPRGMGDAVLCFQGSPVYPQAEHVLLVWGDIPFIQPDTVAAVVQGHLSSGNDLTLATRRVESAYTVVARDAAGNVEDVLETREMEAGTPRPGERDIGLFAFRTRTVMDALAQDIPHRFGRVTGEHGFLYVIGHLVRMGMKVEALPVATGLDLVSLNALEDLKGY